MLITLIPRRLKLSLVPINHLKKIILSALIALLGGIFVSTVHSQTLAPGYSDLSFQLEPAGSYELYRIGNAADGQVLDFDGESQSLYQLFDDKIVVLGFIYLSCSDVNGCPLTTFVIKQLSEALEKQPKLRQQVKLLSLSFDPERDTAEVLDLHSDHIGADGDFWSLLTTKNQQQLQPILEQYDQGVQRMYNSKGEATGELNHILRVYLIDKNKQIRNIYSASFLHKDVLLNDIKTLAMEP